MPVAHDPAAASARLETRRAGGVIALCAEPLVRRAVRHPAGLADARVFLAGGLLIHATQGDAVVRAEVLGAHGAAQRARVAGAVLVPAHDKRCRRATAMRARDRPRYRPNQRSLGSEPGLAPPRRLELPLHPLHQDASLD